MSLQDAFRVLNRRRVFVVPLLLLTVGLATVAFAITPKQYEAVSSLVVLTPTEVPGAEVDGPVNPFLNFGGSQVTAAEVLAVRMGDATVLKQLEEAGVETDWTFEVQSETGPLALVTVLGPGVEEVTAATQEIVAAAQSQFNAIQLDAGSPESQLVRLDLVSSPAEPDAIIGNRLRNAIAVLGAGIVGTVLLAFAVEGISRSRSRRKGKAAAETPPWPSEMAEPPPWSSEMAEN